MEPNRAQPDVVRIDDATVAVGSKIILGPVSLRVRTGESWAVLGPNGSGKSTLLDLAGGIRHPTTGAVEILEGRLGSVDVREIRARIGFVGHHVAEAIPPFLPVRDVVLTGKRSTLVPWMQTFSDDDRRLADELLRRVRCEALSTRPLETCSQGERQRVMLARALFGRPDLLLLDEPTAGLDLPGRELLLEALSSATETSTTILVTHHVEEIPRTTTHAALLRQGVLVSSGAIHDVLTDANVTTCFDLAISVTARDGRWQAQAR
jgi:iron complex transport system ATP-binding protein